MFNQKTDFDLVECAMAGGMLAWLMACVAMGSVIFLDTVIRFDYLL